jgi:hypothetical protein
LEQLERADPKVIVGDASPPATVRQLKQVLGENRYLDRFIPNIPDVLAQFDPEQFSKISVQSGKPTSRDQIFLGIGIDTGQNGNGTGFQLRMPNEN